MLGSRSLTVHGKRLVVLIAIVASAAFGGMIATALGPSLIGAQTGGEIHACVSNYTGALRIARSEADCNSGERLISWNQQGPGGILDIQFLEETVVIRTEDEANEFSELVVCPDGYSILGGGVQFAGGAITGDIWTVESSAPIEAGSGTLENDAWVAALHTANGEPAEGVYIFDVRAICALLGD